MLGKRGHSDFDEGCFGFQESGKKLRLQVFNQDASYSPSQTLPFAFSTSPSEVPMTVTPGADDMMTPALDQGERQSSMPTEPLAFPGRWRSPPPSASGDLPDLEMDDDNDSDVDPISSQPPQSPRPWARPSLPLSRPSHLSNCPSATDFNQLGGRIPTPIYSTFNHHLSVGGASTRDGLGLAPKPAPLNPLRLFAAADRALPSPIREDLNSPARVTANQLSRLGVRDEDEEMEMEAPPTPDPRSPGLRSGFGRARSGAFTEKKRFAMGYRHDCVKCETRVPGHFSHFLSE
ncbi:MAG: hypothetical protein M1821_001349 [Bathelium mastoideum]|nr:MAG: hypothetical protein M1821_001349 [Bathelium mastoideum]KAI9689874.1 MAG: hypothetical protein M1822_009756 [Bathelium mastoideum]